MTGVRLSTRQIARRVVEPLVALLGGKIVHTRVCVCVDDTYELLKAGNKLKMTLVTLSSHTQSCTTLGHQGLGYAGISNVLAVEFDTYFNAEILEPYENHVSVQTR